MFIFKGEISQIVHPNNIVSKNMMTKLTMISIRSSRKWMILNWSIRQLVLSKAITLPPLPIMLLPMNRFSNMVILFKLKLVEVNKVKSMNKKKWVERSILGLIQEVKFMVRFKYLKRAFKCQGLCLFHLQSSKII